MIRKFTFNVLIAYLLFPLYIFVKDLIIIKPEYYRYDFDRSNLVEYVATYINFYLDIFMPTLLFLFALIPFQFIKDYRYRKNKKSMPLWKKCLILSGIVTFWFAVIFRPPVTDMEERIFLFGSLFTIGTITALILYFAVDRYVERQLE